MEHFFINEDEAIDEIQTMPDMLRWVVSQFNNANLYYGHGTDNAWDEAIYLVCSSLFLPLDIDILPLLWTYHLTISEREKIIKLVLRRINNHIPVAYLTNKAWFCGHEFYVDERVLIPRSPIGELINDHFSGIITSEPITILDMCTGSGCIAISCAYEFPYTKIYAVDISDRALAVTEQNIINHGFSGRIIPIQSDLFKDMPLIEYNLILSNPPYVSIEDMFDLPAEYMLEPKLALVAGYDGLKFIKQILSDSVYFLTLNGILICEVGNSMCNLVEQYPDIPFTWLNLKHGGHGVFMLTKQQLLEHHEKF